MSLITEFITTEHLVKAIYLTLLHSLWQGAAIAGLAGLVLIISKRSSAASRYNFLAGSMAFFILCAILTFIKFSATQSENHLITESLIPASQSPEKEMFIRPLDQFFFVLSSNSNRIVLLWFLIICLKSIHLYYGLQTVSNLKTKQTSEPEAKWTSLINSLVEKLGIRRSVKLLESGLSTVPLTVGFLKPVILVPFGMLAAIPSDQVEAIILHELAHIKRKDYFINIFQSVVEMLFFFNPAIWWLSSLIRAERENCCDDIAIANCSSSKITYVRALVSFEEYRIQHPQTVLALTGTENTLLKRTRRIIYNQNNTLNSMEKFILTTGLVLSGLLSLAFTDGGKEQISKTLKPVVSTITKTFPSTEKALAAFGDTIPASNIREVSIINGGLTTINAVHKGKSYKILMKDDEVTELYVDNKKIADEKLGEYTAAIIQIIQFNDTLKVSELNEEKKKQFMFAEIDAINSQKDAQLIALKANEARISAKLDELEAGKFKALSTLLKLESFSAEPDTLIPPHPKAPEAPLEFEEAETPEAPRSPKAPKAPKSTFKAMPGREIKNIKVELLKDQQINVAPKIEVHQTPQVKPKINIAPNISRPIEVHETPASKPTMPDIENKSQFVSSAKIRTAPKLAFAFQASKLNSIKYNNTNGFSEQMNKELIREGLVKDPGKFSYKINNKELIVDGIKQKDDLHSRIISKFLKSVDQNIDFTYSKN